MVLGQALAERWLTDTATLESPTASGTGWTSVATAVPCRMIENDGSVRATAGGLLTVAGPRVHFPRGQTLGVDWRITLTSRGNRRLKIDSIVAPLEAPTQYVTASGTR